MRPIVARDDDSPSTALRDPPRLLDVLEVVLGLDARERVRAVGWRRAGAWPRWDEAGRPVWNSRRRFADARAAWEALATAGVIPLEWVDDPARAFVDVARLADGRPRVPLVAAWPFVRSHPPTVAAAVALASDPRAVATAEAIARELAGDTARRVAWRVAAPRAVATLAPLGATGCRLERIAADVLVLVAPEV